MLAPFGLAHILLTGMDYTIWEGMLWSGALIGICQIIMKKAHIRIPRDLRRLIIE